MSLDKFKEKANQIIEKTLAGKSKTAILICTGGGCIASGSLEIK